MKAPDNLLELATLVSDGSDLDWNALEGTLGGADQDLLRELKVIAGIAALHRSTPPEHETSVRTHDDEEQWGELILREQLGAGAFGRVYRAWDPRLEREIALKIYRARPEATGGTIGELLSEGRLLARVRHPNVLIVYGVEERGDEVGLRLDLIDGRTLAEEVRTGGPIGFREAALTGQDLCRALAAVHRAGLVHRDVKPQNVMRERGGRVVLMDFGIGRDLRGGPLPPGDVGGTPLYMAPELFEGADATPASDIHSLGVLLFYLVSGTHPVTAGSRTELQEAHRQNRRRLLRDVRPDLPEGFIRVVERACAPDPRQRFATAGEMEAALGAVIGGPVTPPAPSPRFGRRAALAVSLLIVLGLAAIVVWNGGMPRTADTRTRTDAPAALRRSVGVLGFRNLSGRPEHAWMSTGLMVGLGSELAIGEQLRIVPDETISRVKAELGLSDSETLSRETLARIRRNIGADLIVAGSYVAPGPSTTDPIRLDIRVQDAREGETIVWLSETGSASSWAELIARTGAQLRTRLGVSGTTPQTGRTSLPANPLAAQRFSEGVARLRLFDARSARDLLLEAARIEPLHPGIHAALAAALATAGQDAEAQERARLAFELSADLPRAERWWIEGRHHEMQRDWSAAARVYETLFDLFPDDLEYGLRLVQVQYSAGAPDKALATLARIRSLPSPLGDDPRVDLAEAEAAENLSRFQQELESATRAAAEAERRGATLLLARSRISRAWALHQLRRYDEALEENRAATSLYQAAGDPFGTSRALVQMGATFMRQEKPAAARDSLEEAIRLAEDVGNARMAARAVNNLAGLHWRLGDLARAQQLYEQSVDIHRTVADKAGLAQALENLASVLYERGSWSTAERHDAEALALRRDIGNPGALAHLLINMAESASDRGRLPEAVSMCEEAAQLSRETGSRTDEAYALHFCGVTRLRMGDVAAARKAHSEALALRRQLDEAEEAASSSLAVAELDVLEGRADTAATTLRAIDDTISADVAARAGLLLARIARIEGRGDEALEAARGASKSGTEASRGVRVAARIELARALAARGAEAQALREVESALAEATRAGLVAYALEARLVREQIDARPTGTANPARAAQLEREASSLGFGLIVEEVRRLGASGRR